MSKPIVVWCALDKLGRVRYVDANRSEVYRWFCGFWDEYKKFGWTVRKFRLVPVTKGGK